MPFTTLHIFEDNDVNMRYRTPLITAGINKKNTVVTPPGVYKGFRLQPHLNDNWLAIVTEGPHFEHYAVYQTVTGYSVSVHNKGGNFNIDLTSLIEGFDKHFIIAIYAPYIVGSTTVAEIRAYETDPDDEFISAPEKEELVVLGACTVPAGGGVLLNVSNSGRTSAWRNRAIESLAWPNLIKNGSFEYSEISNTEPRTTPYWIKSAGTGSSFEADALDSFSGAQSIRLDWASGTPVSTVSQIINVPCVPGQLLKLNFFKKQVSLLTTGVLNVSLDFIDQSGLPVSTINRGLGNSLDTSWVEVNEIFEVPTGAVYLKELSFTASLFVISSSGTVIRLDNLQVRLEPTDYVFNAYVNRLSEFSSIGTFVGNSSGTSAHINYDTDILTVGSNISASVDTNIEDSLEVKGSSTLGLEIIGTPSESAQSRINVVPRSGGALTCLSESLDPGGQGQRIYVTDNGRMSLTSNARWDGASWSKDVIGQTAVEVRIGDTGVDVFYKEAATNSWIDGNWQGYYFLGSFGSSATLDLSSGLRSTDPDNDIPRIGMVRGAISTRTLLWQIDGQAVSNHVRVYALAEEEVGSLDTFEITINAKWTNSTGLWVKDVDLTDRACRLILSTKDFILEGRDVTVGTWNDTGWTSRFDLKLDSLGDLELLAPTSDIVAGQDISATNIISSDNIEVGDTVIAGDNDTDAGYFYTQRNFDSAYDGGDGLSTTIHNGRQYNNNMIKAWGLIWNFTGGLFLLDGFGVESLSAPDINTIRVTMGDSYDTRIVNSQPTFGYSVISRAHTVNSAGDPDNTPGSGNDYFTHVSTKSFGFFDLQRRGTINQLLSWTGSYQLVQFMVLGTSTV